MPYQYLMFIAGVKRPAREADQSPVSEVRDERSCTYIPLFAFVSRRGTHLLLPHVTILPLDAADAYINHTY